MPLQSRAFGPRYASTEPGRSNGRFCQRRCRTIMQAKLPNTGLVGALLAAEIAALSMPAQAQGQATAHTAATHLFVKRDNAETLEPSATTVSRVMLTADQTNGRYSVIDEIFQPGLKTPLRARRTLSDRAIWSTFPGRVALGRGGRRRVRPRDHALRTRRLRDRVAPARCGPSRGTIGRTSGGAPGAESVR